MFKVHGHTIYEIQSLLSESCAIFDSTMSLDISTLGGWSNINIRGQYADGNFVLKLPWRVSKQNPNYYKSLFDISHYYNRLGIAASPLSIGTLPDKNETPFIIFEYVEGDIHQSVEQFSDYDISLLKESLKILYRGKPAGLRDYHSPASFLSATHSRISSHEFLRSCSKVVSQLNTSLSELLPMVQSHADSLGRWTSSVMHGDLWFPNIVIQSDKVVLLDFEDCVIGNRFYDLAFFHETPATSEIMPIPGLLDRDDAEMVTQLRPIALSYIIIWSIERLLSMEAGCVEPNLSTPRVRVAVIEYTRSKIERLKKLL
ncbi:MAG: aminoglycoside phosphotransferase family protein [Candidatus Thorarchaeota archaeon]